MDHHSKSFLASHIPKDYRSTSPLFPDDLFIIGGHPAEPRKKNLKEIDKIQSNLQNRI